MKDSEKIKKTCTYRSADVQAAYDAYLRNNQSAVGASKECALCDRLGERNVVEDFTTVRVVENDYPYEVFTGLVVTSHLLLLTKRHVGRLGQLTVEEDEEYWRVLARYSDNNFNLLTQSASGSARSIPDHIHTHLINCDKPIA